MRKLYGNAIRNESGLTKTLKSVTTKNAHLFGGRPRELSRVAREVQGTFEKVYEETVDAVEDFLEKCKSVPGLAGG
jgi:phosphatidylethanolamine N-methyltransferase